MLKSLIQNSDKEVLTLNYIRGGHQVDRQVSAGQSDVNLFFYVDSLNE